MLPANDFLRAITTTSENTTHCLNLEYGWIGLRYSTFTEWIQPTDQLSALQQTLSWPESVNAIYRQLTTNIDRDLHDVVPNSWTWFNSVGDSEPRNSPLPRRGVISLIDPNRAQWVIFFLFVNQYDYLPLSVQLILMKYYSDKKLQFY